jgi:hypothetical protein
MWSWERIGDKDEFPSDHDGVTYGPYSWEVENYRWKSTAATLMIQELADTCQESRSAVKASYSKTFGDIGAFPNVWFNFNADTLYLNWGLESGRLDYRPDDLGDVASKVKHLAIHQRPYNLRVRYDHEECILKALASFSNVETLTMVNQRHQLAEQVNDCSNLDFMDPVELVMWGRSGYSHNTAMPDMTKMDRLVLDDQAFAQSRLSYLVKAKLKSRWLKRSIPKVDHKIITTFDMKHALERTVGGADKVKNLT